MSTGSEAFLLSTNELLRKCTAAFAASHVDDAAVLSAAFVSAAADVDVVFVVSCAAAD